MEYNTSRNQLIIPEYGRHVQEMLRHAITIQDPRERQAFAEKVVNLVVQMNAQSKNIDDFRDKVWKHVFRITHFELDVLPPNGVIPNPEDLVKKPERVPYPQKDIQYRHYGSSVQKMIEKAVAMEDSQKKEAFAFVIASYMKLAYRTWNKEHYVSDDVIISDLEALSKGRLSLHEDTALMEQQPGQQNMQQRPKSKQQGGYHSKQKYQQNKGSSSNGSGNYKRKRNKRK